MSKFLHADNNDNDAADNNDDNDTKALEIPWVFSENSQAKNCRKETRL